MIDIGILLLRIAVGITMLAHGLIKFKRREYFENKWSQNYGFHKSFVLLNGILQTGGSILILAGLFTAPLGLILALDMVVATWVSIWKHGEPFLSNPDGKGWDVNFTLILGLFALFFLGDGALSIAGLIN
jgi:putative oxidoreductase